MAEQALEAVAQVILSNKEQLVLVRPLGKLLVMSVLEYATQTVSPEAFEEEVGDATVSKQELTLAKRLVEDMLGRPKRQDSFCTTLLAADDFLNACC